MSSFAGPHCPCGRKIDWIRRRTARCAGVLCEALLEGPRGWRCQMQVGGAVDFPYSVRPRGMCGGCEENGDGHDFTSGGLYDVSSMSNVLSSFAGPHCPCGRTIDWIRRRTAKCVGVLCEALLEGLRGWWCQMQVGDAVDFPYSVRPRGMCGGCEENGGGHDFTSGGLYDMSSMSNVLSSFAGPHCPCGRRIDWMAR